MRLLREIAAWLRALLRRESVERELDKEMRFHLEMETEANIARGMSPTEARRKAAVDFGGVERHKESARDARGTRGVEALAADFRYAFRTLLRNRGFTTVAVLTLAIGIGATAGVYTLANWVLYRPVPGIVRQDELVIVSFEEAPGQTTGFSSEMLRGAQKTLTGVSGLLGTQPTTVQLGGPGVTPREIPAALVAGDYFALLGVRPVRGRFFSPEELDPGSRARAVVVSEVLWEGQLGGDNDVLGRLVRVNGNDFTIIGVAPRAFRGVDRLGAVDVWFTAGSYATLRHQALFDAARPDLRWMRYMVGRLRPGATRESVQEELRQLTATLIAENPKAYGIHKTRIPTVYDDVGTPIFGRQRASQTVQLMLGIVSLVLLIACANVANLLLLRGLARRPEFAVRKALGASAFQLVRLHTAEGLLIGLLGGIVGVAVAYLVAQLLQGVPIVRSMLPLHIEIDARVLGFVLMLSIATGLLFGLVPGVAAIRGRLVALGDAGRTTSGRGGRSRAVLMVVQVASAVPLIAGAFLLTRTIVALRSIELGFDPENVTAIGINPAAQGYQRDSLLLDALRSDILKDLQSDPRVTSVTLATCGTPQCAFHVADIRRPDVPDPDWTWTASIAPVSAEYFNTLRIPVLAGRSFLRDEERRGAAGDVPVLLELSTARRFFGNRDPIGQLLQQRTFGGSITHRVIGIVGDARAARLREGNEPTIYVPLTHSITEAFEVVVRSELPPREVGTRVRQAVDRVNPSLAIDAPIPMREMIEQGSLREERLFLRLIGLLGALAAVLATVGLYGLAAYAVVQRRREIGIRIALGAGLRNVVRAVTGQTAVLAGIGLALGLVGASYLAKLLESRLFAVERLDPLSFIGTAAVLTLLAVVASIAPARSAAAVDPVETLRAE